MIRFALLLACLLIFTALVAAHGFVRALAILVAVTAIATVPRTEAWKLGERWLVQLTGSRRRAAALVMFVVIGALAAVNLYNLTH